MIINWTDICREGAEELGISEEEFRAEILRYTKDIREAATQLKNVEIYLFGLGILKVRYGMVKEFIDRLKIRIANLELKRPEKVEETQNRLAHFVYLHNKHKMIYKHRKSNLRAK